MRILNVTQSYAPFFEFGGPPAKVKALSEGLAARGHEVTVLTSDWGLEKREPELSGEVPATPGPFGKKRESNGVTTIYLPNWFHYRAISWNPALGRYLRARLSNFDVVHIFGLYDLMGPRVASECQARKIPYIVEPIGMFVPIVRSLLLKRLYHRSKGRRLLGNASAIVATSEQESSELQAGGIPQSRIVLRRNGVELPEALPLRGFFRRALGIPDGAKLLLFLGRLSRKKSPDLLLNAFAEVLARQDSLKGLLHLAFVGPDESGMRASLEATAARAGLASQVHFAGPLSGETKWAAYRDADIFVLPSQNENFGNTAAEAVAAGTPVILTEQCGIAPLLADRGALVIPHEQSRLVSAIEALLLDDSQYRTLRDGCAKAVSYLSWDEPLQAMDTLYRTLAGPPHS
jgi:glycosyltransferase involved in cell wall biosynthesis